MGIETIKTLEKHESSENNVDPEFAETIANSDMFELPNKPKLTNERLISTVNSLAKQYTIALQNEEALTKIRLKIDELFKATDRDRNWINNIKEMIEEFPEEAAPKLMKNLGFLSEEIREDIVRLALEKAPKEAAPELMKNLGFLPEEIQKEIALLAFEKAPQETTFGLINICKFLSKEMRKKII